MQTLGETLIVCTHLTPLDTFFLSSFIHPGYIHGLANLYIYS